MKRKKLVSLCLAASMTAGMLAGCGAGETKETAGTKGEDVYKRQAAACIPDQP